MDTKLLVFEQPVSITISVYKPLVYHVPNDKTCTCKDALPDTKICWEKI